MPRTSISDIIGYRMRSRRWIPFLLTAAFSLTPVSAEDTGQIDSAPHTAEAVCQLVRADNQCRFTNHALAQFEVARQAIGESFKETGKLDPDALNCFLTAYNLLLTCANAQDCAPSELSYGKEENGGTKYYIRLPELRHDVGFGGIESFSTVLKGTPGNCALSEAETFDTAFIQNAKGERIAQVLSNRDDKKRMIVLKGRPTCSTPFGDAERMINCSSRGAVVVDDIRGGRVSLGRAAEMKSHSVSSVEKPSNLVCPPYCRARA